jgi:environmental stress-induced protein Ves
MDPMIAFARSPSVTWANGLGRTTELVSWTRSRELSGAAAPPWRLSIAELAGPAPFSPLPGVLRHLLPVGGRVTLSVNGSVRRVGDGTVTEFAGDNEVELVELGNGACHAVNLMVRAGRAGSGAEHRAPILTVGDSGRHPGPTCLVAVSLSRVDGIDRFDVLDPMQLAGVPVPLPLALVGVPD